MAKILQRKIFCVVAQPSFAEATYAYYDIKEKKQYGKTFTTAVERGFSANDVAKWLQALKTECNKMARTGISPLVILFTPGHYEWLRFSTHPKPFPQQDPEDEDSLMDIIADAQPSSEDADLMQTGSVCVRQDARSERQLDTERSTTTERQEEEDIKNFGGSRTEELKTFSTAGINGIAPGKRHELRDLDWDNEDVVTQWTTKYDISKSTLLDWQLQLLAEGSQSTFTPSLPSTQRSEESDWADETEGRKEPRSVVEMDDHNLPGIGRFKAASVTENSSRASVRQIKQSWNSHQAEWGQQTATYFPMLPSTPTQWRAAVDAAPKMLMEMLSRFERPGYILSEMTDSIVDYWTRPARLECLLHCLEQMESKIDDASQKHWLLQCCKDFRLQAETDMSELNLYPREMWTKLEKLKYGNLELLRLCKKNMTQQLSRYVVVSTIYSDELLELSPEFKNPPPTKLIEHLHVLFTTLENRSDLQAILDQPDSAGLWTELEVSLAASPNSQHDGYLGSESPSH
ncbi:hypothetical protein PR003_g23726 [Phytophthora rubi]|uniref:Uncharacterized protein n=2 Tax=Phytophthora rubi TaxID=129364 RepID=A0A6A4CX05_9STRA|nr:hypothetical protein PR003_g23726 [Phytophthora rubi]